MSLRNQIFVTSACFLISFFYLRGMLYGIKRYQLNNSSYKKRKKGETFREWLFYSRYSKEIPIVLRIFYYVVLLIHPICILCCILFCFIGLEKDTGRIIATAIAGFDATWILIIALLFWSPGRDFAYERWIRKR